MRVLLILTMLLSAGLAMAKQITVTKDNLLILDSAFDGTSVAELIQEARAMDAELKSGYPIYLFLNTPGGEIQSGVELFEALKGLNRPIHTITLYAASMGWQLLQHLGDRYVLKYGVLMSHKARGQFSGEFGGGMSQMDSRYGLWLRRVSLMDEQTVKRTNGKKTLKQYRSEYDNELWLNGEEAVQHGYADSVVTIRCSESLNDSGKTREVTFMGLNIEIKMSGCPIITYPLSVKVKMRTNKGFMSLDKFMAEGGKFGKECNTKGSPEVTDYFGTVIKEKKEAGLCAIDESLTFEKVQQIKQQEQKKVTQRANPIYMNFTSGF